MGDWTVGKKKNKSIQKHDEFAILIGVVTQNETREQVDEYLDELEFLALTAGAKTLKRFVQKIASPINSTFVGKGKVEEIIEFIENNDVDLVIFDDDLTGKQTHILEEKFKRKIIDRSSLILDIFASRAQSAQAKAQVELAQMQYLLPRLRGLWDHLERQRGGIGMRGPGEQEIETDRRIVRDKISTLKKRLLKIDLQSQTQRKNRGDLIRVSLVGYTNVGKSTIMNLLSKSDVFAEDKLFATLDTTVRKVVFGRMPFLLSDTVGFIRKLPHHLIESFKSTLDEVRESDILLHVIDMAHPQHEDHINTVTKTLKDLEITDRPTILIFNKLDLYKKRYFDKLLDDQTKNELLDELYAQHQKKSEYPVVFLSAKEKINIDVLRDILKDMVEKQYEIRYPYQVKTW